MRHGLATRKLNHHVNARKALIKNLLWQFYNQGTMMTTYAKAKVVKSLADRMIGQAKSGTVAERRRLARTINNSQALNKLVDTIAPSYKQRTSGFTRIIKVGRRTGDNALLVKLELVKSSKEETVLKAKEKPNEKVDLRDLNQKKQLAGVGKSTKSAVKTKKEKLEK